jgi:hypothetical protein
METIIIDGRRELKDLPVYWHTDGTDEANEWGKGMNQIWHAHWDFVGSSLQGKKANAWQDKGMFPDFTYITPSEFLRLVYEPWKESQKVKLPTYYVELCSLLAYPIKKYDTITNHINACIQLTNIMNFANDAFEGDGDMHKGHEWVVCGDSVFQTNNFTNPIRFTSKAAAEWAYKTFPEIFKAYWNV